MPDQPKNTFEMSKKIFFAKFRAREVLQLRLGNNLGTNSVSAKIEWCACVFARCSRQSIRKN